ncbi:hypothetical protein K493DRAFT_362600 [Basidiobolus meristosporus CBS 931.73]|uniref:Hyaluronan/mRNA-binding protein domain-containing protein n=1 Tax=Basidiobolus meristosporus CBS 931.73 TaxID=1314790 RepID=A0A1Y1X1G4_9FUNG|nr:hypothetical protein K493DRAFT_362600 [Basidiobolus meristosporus CBS 931.73]|eukprot:ORX79458.1 hypothetical protein K493DRAFT_362600 [Basidiobolus meristosporus CBS 931.73]
MSSHRLWVPTKATLGQTSKQRTFRRREITSEQNTHDRHVSRNGAPVDPKSMKKQGAGRGNWGTYEEDIEEALHEQAPTSHQAPTKINVAPQ